MSSNGYPVHQTGFLANFWNTQLRRRFGSSTCTISRLENDDNADWIESELGLIPDDLHAFLPAAIPGIRGNRLQLLPHVHGTDGFFVARFRKK